MQDRLAALDAEASWVTRKRTGQGSFFLHFFRTCMQNALGAGILAHWYVLGKARFFKGFRADHWSLQSKRLSKASPIRPQFRNQGPSLMRTQMWRLTTKIRSGAKFEEPDDEAVGFGDTERNILFEFTNPKELPPNIWPGHKRMVSFPVWEYDLRIEARAFNENDAVEQLQSRLEQLISRLSFLATVPVSVSDDQAIKQIDPETGADIGIALILAHCAAINPNMPTIKKENYEAICKLLIFKKLLPEGDERLSRSLRWLLHSHSAQTACDEFTSLILAFEALSHLLKPAEKQFWRCAKCNKNVPNCPHCGHTTGRPATGATGMQWFTVEKLGWDKKQWRDLWDLRCKILHGSHDLSASEQRKVTVLLSPLEHAVIVGIKAVLHMSDSTPPFSVRGRKEFDSGTLRIEYTHKEQPNEPPEA